MIFRAVSKSVVIPYAFHFDNFDYRGNIYPHLCGSCFKITTLFQRPGGTFSFNGEGMDGDGDESFYQNLNGDIKSIVSSSEIPVGMVFECKFHHSISKRTRSRSGVKVQLRCE